MQAAADPEKCRASDFLTKEADGKLVGEAAAAIDYGLWMDEDEALR